MTWDIDRPTIFGILNVTPDSFSDGGRFADPTIAIEHGATLLGEGADALDVGGESTRPNATPVSSDEEIARVVPVLRGLRERFPDAVLSIDTVKSDVARAAVEAGASIVNDVSGFRIDPRMAETCAELGARVILMHSRGGVAEMGSYKYAVYGDDVVGEVCAELEQAVDRADRGGVRRDMIAIDPGIGFGKRSEHSLSVLRHIDRVVALGFPVMVGVSRKRFIGELSGVAKADERVDGTIAANVMALAGGARIFRVHDVRAHRRALDVAWAILRS
jgi:dihydropteroate synthase